MVGVCCTLVVGCIVYGGGGDVDGGGYVDGGGGMDGGGGESPACDSGTRRP